MSSDVPTPAAARAAATAVMSAWAMAGARTAIQVWWAGVAMWAAREVPWVPMPDVPPGWVEIAVGALAAGTVTAGIGWLERRSRGTWWGRLGTRVGRALMCGIVQQPTYTARGKAPL